MPVEKITPSSLPESWRPIVGFFGPALEVSDQGRIRYVENKRIRETLARDSYGYPQVNLKHGKDKRDWRTHKIHKLVLEAFVGPRPVGFHCRHLNGDKRDNRLSNLKWGSPLENGRDRVAHGRSAHGERQGLSKLTYEAVEKIRQATGPRGLQTKLAREYGVSIATISRVRLRQGWGPRRFRVHIPTGAAPGDLK